MRIPVKKNSQLSPRTDLSRTKSIRAESPCLSHAAIGRLHKYTVEKLGSVFKFGHHVTEGVDTIITSLLSPMCLSVNQQTRTFPTDPVLTFSAKENSRSFLAVDDGIDLDSVTDVDIGETTESKATKSKIKTEVEENYPSTNCRLFLLIIQLRQCRKFAINELQICL